MVGKASLIIILGFTFIFIVMGYFWGEIATRSVENHTSYYKNTIAHNIAVSGANLALRELWQDSSWTTGFTNKAFSSGEMNVTVTNQDSFKYVKSIGEYMSVEDTVYVTLMKSTYTKYAWFIASVSTGSTNKRTWITGDTVWGGFATNQTLNIDGDPVFYGRVYVNGGVKMTPGSNPQFLGGLVTGFKVPWDPNMKFTEQRAAAVVGQSQAGAACFFEGQNLWLTFNANGTVTYRTAATNANDDSSLYSAPITKPLSQMAPNGIIYLDKGDMYVSGTLDGVVTIVSDQSSGMGGGNVYFTGDMVNEVDPMLPDGHGGYIPNEAADDVMGILATNNVNISTSVASGGQLNNVTNLDINVDASIFCRSGGFNMENLGGTTPKITGTILLQGSMIAGKEEMVAIYDNKNQLTAGYNRKVILDERNLVTPPLWYPAYRGYEVISWLE